MRRVVKRRDGVRQRYKVGLKPVTILTAPKKGYIRITSFVPKRRFA